MKFQLSLSVCLLLFFFYSCSDSNEQIDHSDPTDIQERKIIIQTNGTSRVLIQQLDPPSDLFVMQMKAGDRNETIGRGTILLRPPICKDRGGWKRDWLTGFWTGYSGILGFESKPKKGANVRPFF